MKPKAAWLTCWILTATLAASSLVISGQTTARKENQPIPDLGNGYYRNPIIPGDYADPSVIRVGEDYYMTHSNGGGGLPNMHVWHSRDLVNWRVISQVHRHGLASQWAPDIVYHEGKYYIYTTLVDRSRNNRGFENVVFVADDPAGPWSQPIVLGLYGYIDPGHIVDQEGTRWLYMSKGTVVQLSEDGTAVIGEPEKVYDGWEYPDDWVVECFCLESPKLFFKDGWYYMISAQGGTVGPSTSHMIVAARSRQVKGPWENSPYNPMLRTLSRDQTWWSVGHGTLIPDIAGDWWCVYHGILNGYRSIGRQTLLSPVRWTADGWPVIENWDVSGVFPKPAGNPIEPGMAMSDTFTSPSLGPQWYYFAQDPDPSAYQPGGGQLKIQARGDELMDGATLFVKPTNLAYEATVELQVPPGAEGALLLHTGPNSGGISVKDGKAYVHWRNRSFEMGEVPGNTALLRVRNDHHDGSYAFSIDQGLTWIPADRATHFENTRTRIALVASGSGEVTFRHFRYHGLE